MAMVAGARRRTLQAETTATPGEREADRVDDKARGDEQRTRGVRAVEERLMEEPAGLN
jgi:hypothetical protein